MIKPNRVAWLLLLLSGCAGYSITRDGKGDGYDVYKPEPYLLLVSGPKGHSASIVWLPDYGTRYRVDTWNFMAKADYAFDIEDGWKLTGISDESDMTALPRTLVKAFEEARKSEVIPLSGEPFQLFKILYAPDGRVRGLAKLKLDLDLGQHQPPAVPN